MAEAVIVRLAGPHDREAISKVERAAFPTAAEAQLVEALVARGDATFSLVAEDGQVIGHLLCSRMSTTADGQTLRAVGLGPVAVLPERQHQGVGSMLIENALVQSREAGEEIIFLVGDPSYYARFGFTAAIAAPFASPYAGEYFLARWLAEPRPVGSGRADYAPAFAMLEG